MEALHPDTYGEQKQQLLERMLTLSRQQLTCMEENREDDLAAILDESETLRSRIDALDATHGGGTLTSRMRQTLEEIRRCDEQCAACVRERLLFYRTELKNIRQSGKNMQKYVNPYLVPDGVFIDTRK